MVIELVCYNVLWLNGFSPTGGLSTTYSLRDIMTVKSLYFNKHSKVFFGKYIESQEDDNPTNTMPEQT